MKKNTKNKRIWNSSCATSETQWEWNGMAWRDGESEFLELAVACEGSSWVWEWINLGITAMQLFTRWGEYPLNTFNEAECKEFIGFLWICRKYIWHCIVSHVHMVLRLLWRRSSDPTSYASPPSIFIPVCGDM